jgi:hypothetical protein
VAPTTTERPTAAEVTASVRVVGSGLTNGQVVGCNTAGGRTTGLYPTSCPPEQREPIQDSLLYGSVSYGFVIENTGDQVIQQLPVTYRFLDAQGEVIVEHQTAFSDDDPTGETEHMPALRPGESVGVGGMRYPGQPDAAEVRVEIGEPGAWLPEDHWDVTPPGKADRGALTVTDVDVQPGESDEPVTTFTVESSYGHPVSPTYVYVVFYDAEGRIVGGADEPFGRVPGGGSVDGEVALDDPIEVPGIDVARTEVYFPGFRTVQR